MRKFYYKYKKQVDKLFSVRCVFAQFRAYKSEKLLFQITGKAFKRTLDNRRLLQNWIHFSFCFSTKLLFHYFCVFSRIAILCSQRLSFALRLLHRVPASWRISICVGVELFGFYSQSEIQKLLFWYFNLEYQVQSLIMCSSICVLNSTFSSGVIFILLLFCALQTFVLCWMGTRVTSRIDQLSFEISKSWYLMTPQRRKSLQMILHWAQNMKRFSGMFKTVNLETCKSVRLF